MKDIKIIIEALVFASENPLTIDRISEVLGGEIDKKEIGNILSDLMREYNERNGGFCLEEVAGGFQFRTRTDLGEWIKKLRGVKPTMLTQAAMETLAVVAYRQPVVKSEIDRIRGVDVSGSLRGLLEKKLAKMVGRKDVPGRPMLYGTTKKFLEVFNLKDLSELPTLRELKELEK
ncbi:MAG: SMC-Scp complex subunit ScpB [Thermodesulfobacteriota bacterium]|nr:SMC-Scp complex subunit ScpB [Thermodesulfobacteriota bacterium]